MAVAREPSPPMMPHSFPSYRGSSPEGGDSESVMSDLSWDGTPDENILSGSSRAATSLTAHEENEGDQNLRYLDDGDGEETLMLEDGLYHQLAEMEEKLRMAGEFGKALLEENQELRMLHQQIQQETGTKIEALEQERHELRMKLETAHTEKDNISYDMRMEMDALSKELANQSTARQVADSNKKGVIGELVELRNQNEKLIGQLKEVTIERDTLTDRLKALEQQQEAVIAFNQESSLAKAELLKAEMEAVKQDNANLEDRLMMVSGDREAMMSGLEEARERNMMLEKQFIEMEQRLQFRETELRDLSRLHEETLQELTLARSCANTHCSSSILDDQEAVARDQGILGDLDVGDLKVNDRADMVMMARFLNSQATVGHTSLADELAAMEPSRGEAAEGTRTNGEAGRKQRMSSNTGTKQSQDRPMSLADELSQSLSGMDASRSGDVGGSQQVVSSDARRNPSQDRSMSLAEEFSELGAWPSPRSRSGHRSAEETWHGRGSPRDELSQLQASWPNQEHGGRSLADEMQALSQDKRVIENVTAVNTQQCNTLSLADEFSQASAAMPYSKVDSSQTLVSMGQEYVEDRQRNVSQNNLRFLVGGDEDEEEETMMQDITMATQPSQPMGGMSLADELANTGYQQAYQDDADDEEEEDEVRGRMRVVEEDDIEVLNQETPKASPRRRQQVADSHIKYQQIDAVLRCVHVTLSHIILELHPLTTPLSDHSPHPSAPYHTHPYPTHPYPQAVSGADWGWGMEYEEDDDDALEGVPGSGGWSDLGSEVIGDKVKGQLSILRSMLAAVVNGAPRMLGGETRSRGEDQERISQLLGQMEALEVELGDTRLQVDLLEAEVDRLDKVLLRKDEQIDRLQQGKTRGHVWRDDCVPLMQEDEGGGDRKMTSREASRLLGRGLASTM